MAVMATESPFLFAFSAYVIVVAMMAMLRAPAGKDRLGGSR
jgi:hypothetical protein